MPIELRCSHCGRLLRVPDDSAGKTAKCPECGGLTTVPEASTPGPPPSAASPNPFADTSGAAVASVPRFDDPANPYAAAISPVPPAYEWKTVAAGDLVHSRVEMRDIFTRSWEAYTRQVGAGVLLGLIVFGIMLASVIVSMPLAHAQQAAWGDVFLFAAIYTAGVAWGIVVGALSTCLTVNFGLKAARGYHAPLERLFDVGHCYLRMVGFTIPIAIINLPLSLAWTVTVSILSGAPEPETATLVLVSFALLVPPLAFVMILLNTMLFLSSYFIVERRMGVIASMASSIAFMRGNKRTAMAVIVPAYGLGILAATCSCGILYVFVLPYLAVLGAIIYVMVTGQPVARGVPSGAGKKAPASAGTPTC